MCRRHVLAAASLLLCDVALNIHAQALESVDATLIYGCPIAGLDM